MKLGGVAGVTATRRHGAAGMRRALPGSLSPCLRVAGIGLAMLALACAPAAPGRPAASGPAGLAVPQRPVVIAFVTEPPLLEPGFLVGTGNRDFSALTGGFLAYLTPQQQPMPYLAEQLPTLDRGDWRVLPDGRMETTFKLRPTATWHDGKPVTAHDFVFAHRVRTDPTIPVHQAEIERKVGSARALDDHTLLLDWRDPYIWAGMVFGPNFAPMPSHLLEGMYATDKEAFINGAHWREEFVGAGPYRLERWEPGVEMSFRAHPQFVLGRPPIDHVLVRFITDANTIVANLLAGTADAAFHSSIAYAQGQALEQAGWPGTVEYWRGNPRFIEYQQRDWANTQRAVWDARVRRALLHAIDRQAMVDSLYGARAPVHHFWLDLSDPAYAAVDRAVSKYEYNPGRAEALLREAGWTKGSDGAARSAAGETLSVPMLNHPADLDMAEGAIVIDYWKAIGVSSEITRLTPAQMRDGEYRSKFAGVAYNRRGLSYEDMVFTTPNIAAPDNRWAGQNRVGYSNPALDDLWPRALAAIDLQQRESLFVEAFRVMTADAAVNPTHLQPRAFAYRAGLSGPKETWVGDSALVWNSWEWHWR